MKEKLQIEGITCQACVAKIERKLSRTEGVNNAVVNISNNVASVDYNENIVDINRIIEIIKKLGYIANKIEKNNVNHKKEEEKLKIELNKALIVIVVSFLIMYISMGNMFGLPVPGFIINNSRVLVLVQLVLTLIVMFMGRKFYSNGFKQLYKLSPNMDSLIAVGTSSAFIYSLYISAKIFVGNNHLIHSLYYESSSMIIAFVMIGKYLEHLSKRKALNAINKLSEIQSKKARILKDREIIEVDIEDVVKDDIVIIKPGEKIPVDGAIIEGITQIDESMLTGESIPVIKSINDKVYSGTINKDGNIKVRVETSNSETLISKIADIVRDAQINKPNISKIVDKVSLIFVPTIILIAIFVSLVWTILLKYGYVNVTGNKLEFVMTIFISILIIACPCSLGLATPMAIITGIGRGAELGILVKNGEALEVLNSVDTVVFDKTGTLTEGKIKLVDIINTSNIGKEELLKIAYSIEINSEHPISFAINEKAEENGIKKYEVDRFKALIGLGVEAVINGKEYYLGNRKLMKVNNIKNINEDILVGFENKGMSSIILSDNKEVLGIFALEDVVREESINTIKKLNNQNIEVIMLTGDNEKVAKNVSEKLGINKYIADVSPTDKYLEIQKLQKEGKKVLMVGDGINDSPSLASANVGIAMGNATDIAIESADLVLIGKNLELVVTAINLGKAIIRNIKQNLFWAFFYNLFGVVVASGIFYGITGYLLNPMIAGLAMGLSSVSVVLNALRLKKFK